MSDELERAIERTQSLVYYDNKGIPHPSAGMARSREAHATIGHVMGDLPYIPRNDSAEEQMLAGLTLHEVGWYRQRKMAALGDLDAMKFCQEHTVGKALQRVQQTTLSGTYKDLLGEIAKKEHHETNTTVDIEDVTVVDCGVPPQGRSSTLKPAQAHLSGLEDLL